MTVQYVLHIMLDAITVCPSMCVCPLHWCFEPTVKQWTHSFFTLHIVALIVQNGN